MATASKCPKCEKDKFESIVEHVEGSRFPFQFIRCKSCKSVITVMDDRNIGFLIMQLAEKLDVKLR